ncbi:MAG TPA: ATP-binding protein [Bacteroidales bacterium]|nr:ATP-binding protein [Bacteroidales bacterium]
MIIRELEHIIQPYLFKNKTLLIYGARQVGKTTLVHSLVRKYKDQTLFLNGDDADVRDIFNQVSSTRLKPIIGQYKIVVIDEAQRIPETGLVLKIIHDNFPNIQLIATGSSAFELANKIKEPLTGRKLEFKLFPVSFNEMVKFHGFLTEKRLIEHRMIYGSYPDIVLNPGMENKLLKSLASSYLYKDLLMLEYIQKPVLLEKLLKALALQISNEVSYNELARLVDSDRGTVEKYIDLLEKAFIIFRLHGLNKNVRNEIKKGKKIYFYDNGIRNAVIGNFLPTNSRTDVGALWENYIISERVKYNHNNDIDFNCYFWRTTQQQETDYVEEINSEFTAFEFKWNPNKKGFLSKTFSKAYPVKTFKTISPKNIESFLMDV